MTDETSPDDVTHALPSADLVAAVTEAYLPGGRDLWWRRWATASPERRTRMEVGALAVWSGQPVDARSDSAQGAQDDAARQSAHRDAEEAQRLYDARVDRQVRLAMDLGKARVTIASLELRNEALADVCRATADERDRALASNDSMEDELLAIHAQVAAQAAVIEAVRALHRQDSDHFCGTCHESWPCPTLEALLPPAPPEPAAERGDEMMTCSCGEEMPRDSLPRHWQACHSDTEEGHRG